MDVAATHKLQNSISFNEAYWPRRWLLLGVTALAISGVFALLLAAGRAPQLKELEIAQKLFSMGLVIHVDLSVLVWFLAVIGMGLSGMLARLEVPTFPYLQCAAFWSMAAGTTCIAISPIDGAWEVVKSNYIPVLQNGMFFFGLGLIAASMLILSIAGIIAPLAARGPLGGKLLWWQTIALIVFVALLLFAANAQLIHPAISMQDRYEFIFWSGGHTLQFAYTMVAMVAWAALYQSVTHQPLIPSPAYPLLAAVSVIGVMYPLYAYARYPVDAFEFQQAFTHAMWYLGGIAPLVVMVLVSIYATRAGFWKRTPALSALLSSVIVFGVGGVIGLMIEGQDVRIPAHYHGSIVGVTLALMGYAYVLLPKFGWRDVAASQTAFWQPVVLAVGQIFHVGGLAYAGGYGVLRKQAATGIEFAPDVKIALGIMGTGGLLAIIGGFMFVLVVWRSVRHA